MNNYDTDTIVAISSPPGRGAIGVVRLSGGKTLAIAGKLFTDMRGGKIASFNEREVYHGRLIDDDAACIDEVLMFVMKGPRSFTGEDMVEISCHGNPIILGNVVDACVKSGARIARPGEFTKRAFINGKIDLTQAEAVAELIRARNESAVSIAMGNVTGRLRSRIGALRDGLVSVLASLEASIDFPEEDINPETGGLCKNSIIKHIKECDVILKSSEEAGWLINGLRVAIVGKTNAGKSSLFNRLLDKERSIVTAHKYTTRDLVEEEVVIDGINVVFTDTAGIESDHAGEVEIESMKRSRDAIDRSDLLLFVVDRSCDWSDQDREIAGGLGLKSGIAVFNKSDLPEGMKRDEIPDAISAWPSVEVSSLYGLGIEDVKDIMVRLYRERCGREESENAICCNLRHANSLRDCRDALQRAVDAGNNGYHEEIVAMELRRAVDSLGEITGEDAGEDLLNAIFSTFCIGK
ncbi:MAG: tRNA uridine-5-carboxymethylaminomethyl(34) synthesis GTPase MnmE [bacterium]